VVEKDKSMIPVNLKCEHIIKPLGIDTQKPVFGWEFESIKNNCRQTVWRIIVSSSQELLEAETGDMWDSGIVFSSKQNYIKYNGKPLLIMTKYWWRVMVWNEKSEPTEWSEPEYFVTGFFNIHQWKGRWLDPFKNTVTYVRWEFDTEDNKRIQDAFAYVAALGERCSSFELRLNGRKAGDDVCTPGLTEQTRALYRTYDIKELLDKKNVIGLKFIKKVSVMICIRYTDGTEQIELSDEGWKYNLTGGYKFLGYNEQFFQGRVEEYDAGMSSGVGTGLDIMMKTGNHINTKDGVPARYT
jgi:hypothetical protein